jgi:hypothetical protein
VVEVTFWEYSGELYPSGAVDRRSATLAALAAYNAAAAADLATATLPQRASVLGQYKALLNNARAGLRRIADAQQAIASEYDAILTSIDTGIDTLIGDPLIMAGQTTALVQTALRGPLTVAERLASVGSLVRDTIAAKVVAPLARLFAQGYVSAAVVAVVETEFDNRPQVLDAATALMELHATVAQWQGQEGETYPALLAAVATCTAYLVEISFTVRQERVVVTDRPRSIIDLCHELYGTVDSALDAFVRHNRLSGSEILEIPKGRRIVYYV